MDFWDILLVGLVAGCSSFFSELAKDLKKFLYEHAKRLKKT